MPKQLKKALKKKVAQLHGVEPIDPLLLPPDHPTNGHGVHGHPGPVPKQSRQVLHQHRGGSK
jgi:hypothetical protein